MSGAEQILAEYHDTVLLLTLNRPERLNAWTPTMREHYCGWLEHAEHDPEVRAVVVTGSGRGFCAGSDLAAMSDTDRDACEKAEHWLTTAMRMSKPVISAINGAAAGTGLAAALFTDVRFAGADAHLTTAFGRTGLVAEHGVAWLLPRIIGLDRAHELLLCARTLSAEQAHDLGLVDRVCPTDEVLGSAMHYARGLVTGRSASALAATKHRIYDGLCMMPAETTLSTRAAVLDDSGPLTERRARGIARRVRTHRQSD